MKTPDAPLSSDTPGACSRSLVHTLNSVKTRSVESSILGTRVVPEDAYLFDDLYISLEPALARKKPLYDQKPEVSSSRLQALDSNSYLSSTIFGIYLFVVPPSLC